MHGNIADSITVKFSGRDFGAFSLAPAVVVIFSGWMKWLPDQGLIVRCIKCVVRRSIGQSYSVHQFANQLSVSKFQLLF